MSSIFSKFQRPNNTELPVSSSANVPTEVVDSQNSNTVPPTIENTQTSNNLTNKLPSIMSNKILLLGIFGLFMLIAAIALQFAARSRSTNETVDTTASNSGPEITGTDTLTTSWPIYQDPYNSYTIKYPATWSPSIATAAENTKTFSLPDNITFEINVDKTSATNIESHLEALDLSRSTAWEGKPSRAIKQVSPIRVGSYDGFERLELVSAAGVEHIIVYIMVDDDVFRFSLLPGSANSINNQELIRQFRLALSTFEVTNQAERLGEWKTYVSSKLAGLSFPSYSISFPATWAQKNTLDETSNTQTLTISRNGYKIIINQAPVGGAVCLFKDSPAFQGSSGDLRSKDYTEYKTDTGYILRRYFKESVGDNTYFLFCGKEESDTYFQTPISFGGLNYVVPAKYDNRVIEEMDKIIKTLKLE